ncbi:MAG: hypothetical protein ABIK09_06900 [Pseudomonadota bacterium]
MRGLTRKDLGHRLGYSNPVKAFRRLDECLDHNSVDRKLLTRLALLLDIPVPILEDGQRAGMLLDERQAREDAAECDRRSRASFEPHLWREHERRWATSTFTVVHAGGPSRWKRIPLPTGITGLDFEEQGLIVRQVIADDVQEPWERENGLWGETVSYLYRVTYDVSIRFSTDGRIIGFLSGRPARPTRVHNSDVVCPPPGVF